MKKLIFSLCFLFVTGVSSNVFCQSRINYTLSEIMAEFTEEKYPGRAVGPNRSGIGYHLFIKTKSGNVAYFTDKDSVCVRCIILPITEENWRSYLDAYNNDDHCLIVDKKNWIYYDRENPKIKTSIKIVDGDYNELTKEYGSYLEFRAID